MFQFRLRLNHFVELWWRNFFKQYMLMTLVLAMRLRNPVLPCELYESSFKVCEWLYEWPHDCIIAVLRPCDSGCCICTTRPSTGHILTRWASVMGSSFLLHFLHPDPEITEMTKNTSSKQQECFPQENRRRQLATTRHLTPTSAVRCKQSGWKVSPCDPAYCRRSTTAFWLSAIPTPKGTLTLNFELSS